VGRRWQGQLDTISRPESRCRTPLSNRLGHLRDELLNEVLFRSLPHVRAVLGPAHRLQHQQAAFADWLDEPTNLRRPLPCRVPEHTVCQRGSRARLAGLRIRSRSRKSVTYIRRWSRRSPEPPTSSASIPRGHSRFGRAIEREPHRKSLLHGACAANADVAGASKYPALSRHPSNPDGSSAKRAALD
jgi:hypothetical protein